MTTAQRLSCTVMVPTAASQEVGSGISQVGIWSDPLASRLLARDIGLLKDNAAPDCCETFASGKFP